MGRVRTKTVKRAGRKIIEAHYPLLSCDFVNNKKVSQDVARIQSKRLRNKIAGYITTTMRSLKTSNVRGISFAIQQAESDRRMEVLPEISVTAIPGPLEVDSEIAGYLNSLNVGFEYVVPQQQDNYKDRRRDD